MGQNIHGHCHCKKIQFELIPPTDFCSHCHCESCRRTHGAAFVTWTSVNNDKLVFKSGEELVHQYESSPEIVWMSCRHCASPLFQTTRYTPGKIYICVASLSSPLDRQPDCHVSFEEKVDWLTINDGLDCYKEKSSDRLQGK